MDVRFIYCLLCHLRGYKEIIKEQYFSIVTSENLTVVEATKVTSYECVDTCTIKYNITTVHLY